MTTFILFTLIVLKIPVIIALWVLWRAWDDQPEQVVGARGDGGSSVGYKRGPRKRGPHGSGGPARRAADRRLEAHMSRTIKPRHTQCNRS